MKVRLSTLARFPFGCLLSMTVCAVGPFAFAQTRPSLGLAFSAGQPTLSLTGAVGTVYSIQYATDLSPTNVWADRTLVQAQAGGTVWTDPSAPTPNQRFYRATSVPAPADTNLVFIQPGTFTMGSPTNEALRFEDEGQHIVTISRGFWMGKYLVTQKDYLSVVGANPSSFIGDLSRPVEHVSWFNATNYCTLRTQQEQAAGLIPKNCLYRLPTESEWESADRAGTTTAFYLGSGLYSGQANFAGFYEYDASVGETYNPGGIYLGKTTPVGRYAPNAWGLYDMIGNVSGWCQDQYGRYPVGNVVDPQGADSGYSRVFRGGSWASAAWYGRSATRFANSPVLAIDSVGFRVVLALGQ